jgi:hypothetical protein
MSLFPPRHAISRARFFLSLAKACSLEECDHFEAYLEAAIIFARAALHRAPSQYKKYRKHPKWKCWLNELNENPASKFFRPVRNFILKQGPPNIGQIIGRDSKLAAKFYFYESPDILATATVERHLNTVETILQNADTYFGT